MKIGCHAVLFTDRIANDTETVLSGLKSTGCQGIEVGSRFFGVDRSRELKQRLEIHELELSGLHAVCLLTDLLDRPEEVWVNIQKAVNFLRIMPNRNIILTGVKSMPGETGAGKEADSRLSDPELGKKMACKLNELARRAKEQGVQIHYHNHDWEFKNDGLLYRSFLAHAPEMKLALDTGWALSAGWQPVSMIKDHPSRYSYVHIRDFKRPEMEKCSTHEEKQNSYADLGTGDVNLKELMETLKASMPDDGWAVIEYERGEVSFERYTNAVSYLKQLCCPAV